MNKVYIQNSGVLDAVAIATFGVNAKDSDNPIGYFGTGLKYAIAVLLREGHEIVIQAGDDRWVFSTKKSIVREKEFDVVYMNDTQLGFTTDLGKNWEMWQAFRELYCNALDEPQHLITDAEVHHTNGATTITVTGNAFHDCYLNRGNVVLESEPEHRNEYCDIHLGRSDFIYYKGVRIYDGFNTGEFTYNIHKGVDISEDRTALYNFQLTRRASTAVITCTDKQLITKILMAERGTFEHEQLDYSCVMCDPTEEFLAVAEGLRMEAGVNTSILSILARHKRLPRPKRTPLTDVQEVMLKRAISFCSRIGYPVDVFPIVTTGELKGGMLGLAEEKTIYLSPDTYGYGTKYLAATLIEEYLHLHTGFGDMTRDLQNHLFNDIVSLGERLIGEPV